MDQLKPLLAGIKTHRFWIISGLIFVAYMGAWFMTTSWFAKQTEERISKIKGAQSTVDGVRKIQLHPNDHSKLGMEQLTQAYIDQVDEAWREQYKTQWTPENRQSVLVWPDLGEDFLRIVQDLYPIETQVKFPTESEPLTTPLRNRYRYYIRDYLPELAKIVGAKWMVGAQGGFDGAGGMMGGGPMGGPMGGGPMGGDPMGGGMDPMGGGSGRPAARAEDESILVDWPKSRQEEMVSSHFTFTSTPTTLEVMYAQEDLWVFTALLDIIRIANGNIKSKYQASIKQIYYIDIGRNASGITSRVKRASAAAAGGGPGSMMDPMGGGGSPMAPGGGMDGYGAGGAPGAPGPMGGAITPGMGDATGTGAAAVADPAGGRYVDRNFKPLEAAKLRAAYDSTNPDDAILAVAKQMPLRIRVRMDQRKLDRLLAAFANYPLQVEIRQVRVNCKDGRTFRGGMGGGSMGGGPMGGGPMGGGMPAMGEGPPGGGGFDPNGAMGGGEMGGGMPGMPGMPGMGGGAAQNANSSWDVDVELYGIINLYNPVNREKIGKKVEEATAEPEPGAETPDASAPAPGPEPAPAPAPGPEAAPGPAAPEPAAPAAPGPAAPGPAAPGPAAPGPAAPAPGPAAPAPGPGPAAPAAPEPAAPGPA